HPRRGRRNHDAAPGERSRGQIDARRSKVRPTMALEPVLIAGEWRQPANPTGSFKAIAPSTSKPLSESYPVSSIDDVIAAFRAADDAVAALRSISPDAIGRFLADYPSRVEAAAA